MEDLHPIGHPVGYILHKGVCRGSIALPDLERWHKFSIGIDGTERPNVAALRAIVNRDMFFLLPNKAPNLVKLQALAREIAHLGIQKCCAAFADLHAQSHDRVAVNARDAFD